jgi:hypothetical protein
VTELTPELLLKFDAARNGSDNLFGVRSCRGLMLLCEHGCGWDSYLIVAGSMRGHVIDDTAAVGKGLPGVLYTFAAGCGRTHSEVLPTFFEWLDDWIERSIMDLAQSRLRRQKLQGTIGLPPGSGAMSRIGSLTSCQFFASGAVGKGQNRWDAVVAMHVINAPAAVFV